MRLSPKDGQHLIALCMMMIEGGCVGVCVCVRVRIDEFSEIKYNFQHFLQQTSIKNPVKNYLNSVFIY